MVKPVEATQVSQSHTRALTNFWRDEKNTVKKIIKLFAAIIGYFFALLLDAATKISNYFVKAEKPKEEGFLPKIRKLTSDANESIQKFAKTSLGKTILASSALIGLGLGYNFDLHGKAFSRIRSVF